MKRLDFAQTITILANLGVIAGIVFLSLEVRQNTAQMRAQAAYSINESVEALNLAVIGDPGFAELLVRGEQSFADLDPVEQRRLAVYFFSEINLAQYVVGLEEEGLSDLHFKYVDFKVDQFRTAPGRREFIDLYVRPSTYFGNEGFKRRLTAD